MLEAYMEQWRNRRPAPGRPVWMGGRKMRREMDDGLKRRRMMG
ncbi:MAG: hypothetical protein ACLTBV_29120 [Enterocloster bolteae]